MDIGKISNRDLEKYVFKNIHANRKEVLSKASVGFDTALMDFENDLIVVSTDPITGAAKNIGYLAINISVNDIACQGADPVGVLLSVLLPENAEIYDLEQIMEDADRACKENNLEIVGGHTEVTDAVNKIILTTTVIARANMEKLPKTSSVKVGDLIVISKDIGLEGTSIILEDLENGFLKDKKDSYKIDIKELSVLEEARIATDYGVKYMHDITEGGVFGALWECSKALNFGLIAEKNKIPYREITKILADAYNLNMYRLISSGSMLMVFDPKDFEKFAERCKNENIKVTAIGHLTKDKEILLDDKGTLKEIAQPASDELYKALKSKISDKEKWKKYY